MIYGATALDVWPNVGKLYKEKVIIQFIENSFAIWLLPMLRSKSGNEPNKNISIVISNKRLFLIAKVMKT